MADDRVVNPRDKPSSSAMCPANDPRPQIEARLNECQRVAIKADHPLPELLSDRTRLELGKTDAIDPTRTPADGDGEREVYWISSSTARSMSSSVQQPCLAETRGNPGHVRGVLERQPANVLGE